MGKKSKGRTIFRKDERIGVFYQNGEKLKAKALSLSYLYWLFLTHRDVHMCIAIECCVAIVRVSAFVLGFFSASLCSANFASERERESE